MLLFDLGNTRLKAAHAVAGELRTGGAWRFDSADLWPGVQAFVRAAAPVRSAWIASVTDPERTRCLCELLDSAGVDVRVAGPARNDALLQLAYAEPASFGVDRWLALRAARARVDGALLLASVGTALTVDVVDAGGRHLGGVIAPSPERAREALLARAPHLARGEGRVETFADNTADAVQSGAVLAAAALVEYLARAAGERLGGPPHCLLTGGGAPALAPWIRLPALARHEDLVLQGLADWAAQAAAGHG